MLADVGLTVTEATGTLVTVIAELPLCPSLVAVIVADPAALAVTSPLAFTVAAAVLLLAHVTTLPGSGVPLASRGVAVSCPVCPTVRPRLGGATLTVATGTLVTVTAALPLCPSLVAVIVADPAALGVTSPLPFTVATTVSLLPHVTTRQRAFPAESRVVAPSCRVCPTCRPAVAGITVTDATGRRRIQTHEKAESLSAALVPETWKAPGAVSAENTPSGVMLPPEALQVTATPVLSPLAVRPYAANLNCCAGSRLRLSGTTMTWTTWRVGSPGVLAENSHAASVATHARRPLDSVCLKVIGTLHAAIWFAVHRSLAARRTWRGGLAVVPWLCVTAFQRLCSEQR